MKTYRTGRSLAWLVLSCWGAIGVAGAGDQAAVRQDPAVRARMLVETVAKSWRGRRGEERLEQVLSAVGEAVPAFAPGGGQEDPWLRSLRHLAVEIALPSAPPRRGGTAAHKVRRPVPERVRLFPEPRALRYRFDRNWFECIDDHARALRRAVERGERPTAELLPPLVRLEALLVGTVPEAELVVAEIERQLDVDDSADEFAAFLEQWRNQGPAGEESFYEALDRTAGTQEMVFFFDAMLADFVQRFARSEGRSWSLAERHDRVHQAFLTYRQYRGFIEAAAYSLVTPPDVPLPDRLRRYDTSAFGGVPYSLRDEIGLLLRLRGDDAGAVVADLRRFLLEHPLPEPLWEAYSPMDDFHAWVKELALPEVDRARRSTEQLIEDERARRLELVLAIRRAAEASLEAE